MCRIRLNEPRHSARFLSDINQRVEGCARQHRQEPNPTTEGTAKPQPKNLTAEIAESAVTAMTSKLREANLLAEAA
jgi:hypothetical protein